MFKKVLYRIFMNVIRFQLIACEINLDFIGAATPHFLLRYLFFESLSDEQ